MSDLRDSLFGGEDEETSLEALFGDDDVRGEVIDNESSRETTTSADDGKLLGMNAGERAFVSVLLFFSVVLVGVGLLLATGRFAL